MDRARSQTKACFLGNYLEPEVRLRLWLIVNGEGGIRTPDGLRHNRFRVCRIQPLCHLSKPLVYLSYTSSQLPQAAESLGWSIRLG